MCKGTRPGLLVKRARFSALIPRELHRAMATLAAPNEVGHWVPYGGVGWGCVGGWGGGMHAWWRLEGEVEAEVEEGVWRSLGHLTR